MAGSDALEALEVTDTVLRVWKKSHKIARVWFVQVKNVSHLWILA